jgi:hypothetical protein
MRATGSAQRSGAILAICAGAFVSDCCAQATHVSAQLRASAMMLKVQRMRVLSPC